ncbi:MAG: hypothetical protein RLZZ630_1793 [Bacteroidota bacterium]|jgi:hypothetical protein
MNHMLTNFKLPIIFLSLALASCQPAEEKGQVSPDIVNNPASASGATGQSATPVIEFPEIRFDFGTINSGEKVKHVFRFKNTGDADLVLSQVKASCGCTTPTYTTDPVAPGEEGEITVEFNSEGISGQVAKDITVLANTTPTTSVLTLSGEVIKVNK